MGDPKKLSPSLSLPPGCRFYPSEEEIFQYYLRLKNSPTSSDESDAFGVIPEMKLWNLNPFDLPDAACFKFGYRGRKRHWYFYRERINRAGGGRMMRAGLGFWKRKGKLRDVIGESDSDVVLGKRTSFGFYSIDGGPDSDNRSKQGLKTDWSMYEYELIDNDKTSFVLCRIFFKSHRQKYFLEHALSCPKEGATMVRHMGIQHDGGLTSDIGEDDQLCPDTNEIGLIDDSFQIPSDSQLSNLVRTSELARRDNAILESVLDAQVSKYILEEDFIELDDLV